MALQCRRSEVARPIVINTLLVQNATGRKSILRLSLLIISIISLFHCVLVFATNMPDNALKNELAPVLDRYNGPYVAQGWSLFAPRPYPDDIHVLARARLSNGSLTGWYDVSKFFIVAMHQNRFTPTRSLFAALQHAAPRVFNNHEQEPSRSIIVRTSAMVLDFYQPAGKVKSIQLELDAWAVRKPYDLAFSPRLMNVARLPWMAMPHVATF
jgi:hypothetical protein